MESKHNPTSGADIHTSTWYVRSFFHESGSPVYLDDGPLDHYLAELVIADIGVDGTIPRGLGRVRVERALLVER